MWKHYDNDDYYVSVHDCHATKITFENGILSFVFDDGIWILNGHSCNTTGENVRTDRAEVQFQLESGDEYDINLYVFEKRFKKTVREEWELSKLMECINNKMYTLEFLYKYKGYNSMLIECWLWSDKKPYHRECEIKLSLVDVRYCWNELCETRE